MKKIGILTFSKSINYGAVLQATALKTVVAGFGADVRFLDHKCPSIDSDSKVFDFKKALSPRYVVPHLVNMPIAIRRTLAFSRFMKKYMRFDTDNPQNYDMIIAGSDQIWNYNMTGRDWFYFLDYKKGNTKKMSYAASFGLSETDPQTADILRPLLCDFDYLSVREKTAVGLCEQISGRTPVTVVDPTLLLKKEDWQKFLTDPADKKGYIFVYTVFNSDTLWDFVYDLSKKTGLEVYTISYSRFHKHNAHYCYDAGPQTWLSFLAGASYVVTNSFHGMAFSINFEKQFYYELPPKSSKVGSRLQDMATMLGLTNRQIGCNDEGVIDYTHVTSIINDVRKDSLKFIESALNELNED